MADRSVTVKLDADVRPFVSAMAKAEAAARKLRESLGKVDVRVDADAAVAQLKSVQNEADRLSKSKPTIKPEVDTAQAQANVADLRARMDELSSRTVGVDLDAGAANAELSSIRGELEQLNASSADPQVRVDSAMALAELRTVRSELEQVDGRTANVQVDADVGGALTAIGLVSAALASLPAAAPIALGVGALGGAFASAGGGAAAFGAVAIPTLTRINEALKQQEQAEEKARRAAGDLIPKWTDLSKAEKELGTNIKTFGDEYVKWQRSFQPQVFPIINKGLDLMTVGMHSLTPLILGGAEGLSRFEDSAKKALQSKQWTDFFNQLGEAAPRAIEGLGNATLNVAGGLSGIIQAFLPYTNELTSWVEGIAQDFEDWGTNLKESDGFKDFLAYAAEQGPKVAEILGNIAKFAGNILQAGGDVGPGVLDFLVHLSEKIASLDPAQIEAVAKGVGLIFAAMKLGASLKIAGLLALAEVLGSMSPGQITALATAIGLVVGAVKGYQIFKTVADFLGGFSSKVDSAAEVAGGASSKFGALSAVFKGGVIAASVVATAAAFDQASDALNGLNPNISDLSKNLVAFGKGGQPAADLLDQIGPKASGVVVAFETFGESASRLAGDNPLAKIAEGFTDFIDSNIGIQLDSGRQSIDNLDKALAATVASGNAEGAAAAFNRLAKQAIDAGTPVEKLKELFPQYAQSMEGIPATTGDVGQALSTLGGQAGESGRQLGEAAQRMTDFKSSVDAFNSQTDAAKGVRDLEKAFNDTKTAVQNAHGVLDLTPGVVGRQRDAVLQARDAFSGLIEKVKGSADAQGALARDTTTARDRVLEQLPALTDLAGKNGSARAQVLELAKAYGISEDDAKKAARGGQDLVEVLAKLKSKDIHVGADVKPAQDAIDNFVRLNSGRKIPISVYTKNSQLAAGGILQRFEQGGIRAMAGGGMSSAGPPAPNIASTPTVIYAEAGYPEAYVPFDPKYRDRAITILGQVADQFGLEVYNPKAQQKVATLTAGLKATDASISTSLDGATQQLDATLGSSGTLTTTVAQVGAVGTQMTTAWATGAQTVSDSVIGVNKAIGISSDMIVKSNGKVASAAITVAEAVAKAAAAAVAAAKGGSAKGSSGSGSGKGSQGSVIPPAPGSSLNSSNSVAGSESAYGLQGNRDAALTNYSRVSAPQQVVVVPAARVSSAESVNAAAGPGGGSGGSGGPVVAMYGTVIRESMDADVVTAKIGMAVDSRG